ncbi:sarcoplasmic reticulum histidine-rich calcium-binding protein-like [Uranotaenia lowii]|uniref:sarcoplasmic reticulum histidine-rich calcium-binding protein-like n=1 Tax=Uranotaenia lowii TaxID=190385 RepID=UPI002479E787|nr:sarcoplasmic reticulum histidine-rich calcium-binding protein-like [Uranotaenia lowii]
MGLKELLVLSVGLWCAFGYEFPGIFDPNPFIPRLAPEVVRVTSTVYHGPVGSKSNSAEGGSEGDMGYVRSHREKGTGGFIQRESFHRKDGNDYGRERQEGFGESKDEGNYSKENASPLKAKKRNYEVTEEHSDDHANPNLHTKYGVTPTKPMRKPTAPAPAKPSTTTSAAPKRTTHRNNHNGYETVIYHSQENDDTGRGWQVGPKFGAGGKDHRWSKEVTEREHDEDDEGNSGREEEEEDDGEDHNEVRSDFGDNYDRYRYGNDFEKNFRGHGGEDRDSKRRQGYGGTNKRKSFKNFGRNNQDYDDEVDKDEIDESANEDRYHGGADDDDDDYEGDIKRQYQYTSEADYDAQR